MWIKVSLWENGQGRLVLAAADGNWEGREWKGLVSPSGCLHEYGDILIIVCKHEVFRPMEKIFQVVVWNKLLKNQVQEIWSKDGAFFICLFQLSWSFIKERLDPFQGCHIRIHVFLLPNPWCYGLHSTSSLAFCSNWQYPWVLLFTPVASSVNLKGKKEWISVFFHPT